MVKMLLLGCRGDFSDGGGEHSICFGSVVVVGGSETLKLCADQRTRLDNESEKRRNPRCKRGGYASRGGIVVVR